MKRIEFTDEYLNKLPKTQEEAIKINSKYYFDGILCKFGHLGPKITKTKRCFICKRESTKESAEKRRRKLGMTKQESVVPLNKGDVFHKLTATGGFKTEFSTERKKNRNIHSHEVICVCGKKYWLTSYQWGITKQCADCSLREMSQNNITHNSSQNIVGQLFYSAKKRAKSSQIEFNIEIEDIILTKYCPILNIELYNQKGMSPTRKPRFNAPSIDRINSELGYIKGNIIVMSYKANVLKKNGTSEEHTKVADYMEKMGITK